MISIPQVKTDLYSILTYEIEQTFGRKIISSRDCIELTEEIFKKTEQQLNPNTLRRFFKLVKADYPPSKSTLNILSKYCGFASVQALNDIKSQENFSTGIINHDAIVHFLINTIENIKVKKHLDETLTAIIMNTIKFLSDNYFLADQFQRRIAKIENGNYYYFELLVNIDKLNSFYGNGLRYYLKENTSQKAELFFNCIHVFKYWLNNDQEMLNHFGKKIGQQRADLDMSTELLSLNYAALLYYNTSNGNSTENVRISIHNTFNQICASPENLENISIFTYTISKALLFTGYFEEALHYIKQSSKQLNGQSQNQYPLNYTHSQQIIEAYALFSLGYNKQAEKIFDSIKTSEFQYLNKNFSCLLYLALLKEIKPLKEANKYDDEINKLVQETGFKKFALISKVDLN